MTEAFNIDTTTDTAFRLSPQQERLWALQSHDGTVLSATCSVRLLGKLDVERLRQALRLVVERFEILHTAFRKLPAVKAPVQVILDKADFEWNVVDGTGLTKLIPSALFNEFHFVLERGIGLSAALQLLSKNENLLHLRLPAVIADLFSLRNLVGEIGTAYTAELTSESADNNALQYADIVEWRSELLESQESEPGRTFWRNYIKQFEFKASASLLLPGEIRSRAKYRAGCVSASADAAALERFSAENNGSVRDVLLAVWLVYLARILSQTTIVLSIETAGRNHGELENAIGPLGRNLPFAGLVQTDWSFVEVLQRSSADLAELEGWQDCFSHVVEEIPMLPLGFSYEEVGGEESYGGVVFRIEEAEAGGEPYTLKLAARRRGGQLDLRFEYDAAKLSAAEVQRFSEEFHTLLRAALEEPQQRVSQLALLGEGERRCLLEEWNRTTADYPAERCFPELFEEQVERTPERAAVRCQGRQWSYRELNERANRLAGYLRQRGAGAEQRVGLCVEPSVEQMVALLAILKAGAAYVALNASHPAGRLAQQLKGVVAVVADDALAAKLPEFDGPVIRLQADEAEWRALPGGNLASQARPENLVYVIYTSGSTGTPKGVQVRHRNLVNYSYAVMRRLGWDQLPEAIQFATVSTLSADLGNTCIYPAWLCGGCVHVIPPEIATDSRAFGRYCGEEQIDVLKIVPTHLRALLDAGGGREILPRRYLVLGGEILKPELVERIVALEGECEIVNHYGPTETTVGSLALRLNGYAWQESAARSIPIGRPLANTRVYVLDAQRQLVPIGVEGELYIGGAGVSAGYLEQAEQTAERFMDDPFSGVESGRMYRTGDRVRYLATGEIEFLGRMDEQVKIRGHRVEPGEVEAVLSRHPGVRQAIVIARIDTIGETQLAAYVAKPDDASLTVAEIQSFLKQELPEYMVPAAVVFLAKLPLTANGKLDRQALPAPEAVRERTYEAPQTEIEQALSTIWEQVLRRERIGRLDNFFDIGGHSLLATQIISRVRRAFEVDLPLQSIFETPTITELAGKIAALKISGSTQVPPLIPISRSQDLQLSFAQQRLWVIDQLDPNNPLYNITRAWRLKGPLNVEALQKSLNSMTERHESQRTTFKTRGGEPVQVIAPKQELPLAQIDLTLLPCEDRSQEARRIADIESTRPFNLEHGPLVRASLCKLSPQEHVLILTMHHIVSDAWSAGVYFRELGHFYLSEVGTTLTSLPDLRIQYADYAVWQRRWLTEEVAERGLAFWRRELAGAPMLLTLPTDQPRPASRTFAGAYETFRLSAATSDGMRQLGREAGVTPFMALLAAFGTLLSRLAAAEQVVIGTDVANRNRVELEHLVGFLINLLPLRVDLSANPTFRELLDRVRKTTLSAYAHQELPFDKIVEDLRPERNSAYNPIVQVLFVMQNVPRAERQLAGLTVDPFEVTVAHSKFDLAVFTSETNEGVVMHWLYSTELFTNQTIRRMARQFETLMNNAIAHPGGRVNTLAFSSEAEQAELEAERKERKRALLRKAMTNQAGATADSSISWSGGG